MKTPLSPIDIEVLIRCHYSPVPHERLNTPAVQKSIQMWLSSGMIEPADDCPKGTYSTTDKGKAMISALCKTPEPRCAWLDVDGKILVMEDRGVKALSTQEILDRAGVPNVLKGRKLNIRTK